MVLLLLLSVRISAPVIGCCLSGMDVSVLAVVFDWLNALTLAPRDEALLLLNDRFGTLVADCWDAD